jgi:RimJ/RimL family protein N-acetyltransferase
MRKLEADPSVMRFTPFRVPQTEEQTRQRLESQIALQKEREPFGIWVAEERESGAFIGWFMLISSNMSPVDGHVLELGFMIVRPQWDKGFATEIAQALIDFASAQGVLGLIAKTNVDNWSSMRVLEKLGFRYVKNMYVPNKVFGDEVEVKVYRRL